jgi:hypothetical protein
MPTAVGDLEKEWLLLSSPKLPAAVLYQAVLSRSAAAPDAVSYWPV